MIDLQKFCAIELDLRKHLHKPWDHKGWRYASNGHILVRAPSPEHADTVFDHKIAASAEGMFEQLPGLAHEALPAFAIGAKCEQCEGLGYVYTIPCDECEDGEFRHGSHTYTCAECDGDGIIEATKATGQKTACDACYGRGQHAKRIEVGVLGAGFDATYLTWIKELPRALIAAREPDKSAHFIFDGGEGLLMPMRDH